VESTLDEEEKVRQVNDAHVFARLALRKLVSFNYFAISYS